jgi:hypothetical protein
MVTDFAPKVFESVSKQRVNKRSVKEAYQNHIWVRDVGTLTFNGIS